MVETGFPLPGPPPFQKCGPAGEKRSRGGRHRAGSEVPSRVEAALEWRERFPAIRGRTGEQRFARDQERFEPKMKRKPRPPGERSGNREAGMPDDSEPERHTARVAGGREPWTLPRKKPRAPDSPGVAVWSRSSRKQRREDPGEVERPDPGARSWISANGQALRWPSGMRICSAAIAGKNDHSAFAPGEPAATPGSPSRCPPGARKR